MLTGSMSDDEILHYTLTHEQECKCIGLNRCDGCRISLLKKEIQRLKAGDFSEEEFQNLCHNFDESDADRFALGCRDYQKLLFGRCAWSNRCLTGAAMVIRNPDGSLLLQQRRGMIGYGTWSVPGGWVELNEHPSISAIRETFEEVGLIVTENRLLGVTTFTDISGLAKGIGTVTVWYEALSWQGTPEIREPDKMIDLGWYPLGFLPSPLFGHIQLALQQGLIK
jgi:8-oxo-dGTP diphosphatase